MNLSAINTVVAELSFYNMTSVASNSSQLINLDRTLYKKNTQQKKSNLKI